MAPMVTAHTAPPHSIKPNARTRSVWLAAAAPPSCPSTMASAANCSERTYSCQAPCGGTSGDRGSVGTAVHASVGVVVALLLPLPADDDDDDDDDDAAAAAAAVATVATVVALPRCAAASCAARAPPSSNAAASAQAHAAQCSVSSTSAKYRSCSSK